MLQRLTLRKLGILFASLWFCFDAAAHVEVIKACMIPSTHSLTDQQRLQIAQCIGWTSETDGFCAGYYEPFHFEPLSDPNMIQIDAEEVSFYKDRRSLLKGAVEVKRQDQILQADTAYVDRDPKTDEIRQITFLNHVKFASPLGMMWANKGVLSPQSKEVQIDQVLYRVEAKRHGAQLSAWGRAAQVNRGSAGQVWMKEASYTHCSPLDKAWDINAQSLMLDKNNNVGVAKNAYLKIKDWPVLYTPYLSFPLSKQRKSGFLMPIIGSTTLGGFDLATPYYLNLAPNYDATIIPHVYGKRGLMLGGEFRYLTDNSVGFLRGDFLPNDKAYNYFLNTNALLFPSLLNKSTNRWELHWVDASTVFVPNLNLHVDVGQLSDDYYLQDFSTNLARVTERQILRYGALDYTTDHWFLSGAVQSYQTLHPVNETPISDVYDRLPQLMAQGNYNDLPLDGRLQLLGAFDSFRWSSNLLPNPNGLRYHANPIFSLDKRRSWGYVIPSVQWVGNAYNLNYPSAFINPPQVQSSNISLPRFSVDSGLYFERSVDYFKRSFVQTLEPRLYYLNVPYRNQNQIPVFDSGYMIFTAEQVFRDNRFSGFDRIGDANQLGYGVSTRWIDELSGVERANLSVAQLKYFANRQVSLCYNPTGICQDNPYALGYLSQTAEFSPVASHGVYYFNRFWSLVGDYVWDPATQSTNNGQVGFHYEAEFNRIFNFGYSYLVNGDITQIGSSPVQNNALNQVTASYAWPFNDRWSTLGAYSYNVSKQYEMMSLLGLQYDSCCWGVRLIGGRTFRNLTTAASAQYTNSVFLQVFLKGLGSVGSSDPTSVLRTYLPGYVDTFRS